MKKQKISSILLVGIFLNCIFLINWFIIPSHDNNNYNTNIIEENLSLRQAQSWNLNYIHINGNWSNALSAGWCKGAGTWQDPYVLENITINAQNSPTNYGIYIQNSNDYFIIRNCTIYNANFANIDLFNSNSSSIYNNTISHSNWGISLGGSNNNTIKDNSFYNHSVSINFFGASDFNRISGNTINTSNGGIYFIFGSDYNNVSNNQFINCSRGIGIYGGGFLPQRVFGISIWNNNFTECGITVSGSTIYELETYNIPSSNLVNNRPLYFYANKTGLKSVNFTNAGQILLLYCFNSILSNYNISHVNDGIWLENCFNISVVNSSVSYNSYSGITIKDSFNCSVIGSNLSNNQEDGIVISGYNHTVKGNTIINNNNGINAKDCYLSSFEENNLINGTIGILLITGDHDAYNNTILKNNITDYEVGLSIRNSFQNFIKENKFHNCGVLLQGGLLQYVSNNFDLTNTVNNKTLYYYENDINLVEGDFIDAGQIILVNCNNSIITNLRLYNATQPINVIFGGNNSILNNTVYNNSKEGIYVYGSNNCLISGNNASYNGLDGLYIGFSNLNNITNNIISNNLESGLYLVGSYDNIIHSNLITKNSEYGVYIAGSGNCVLFNNTFIKNALYNAFDGGVNNKFDNGSLGNYWDDYDGYDSNGDGIGDTPYDKISGSAGSIDNYPFCIYTLHDPILIDASAKGVGAYNWSWAVTQTWCTGSGTWEDPYLIKNLIINGNETGYSIEIKHSIAYFKIISCTLFNSTAPSGFPFTNLNEGAIFLNNVSNGFLINNNCSSNNAGNGILIRDSDNITVLENILNDNFNGIVLYISEYIRIIGNIAKDNQLNGIYAQRGNNIDINNNKINYNLKNGMLLEQGIILAPNNNYNISNNQIFNNNEFGIYLTNSRNNIIEKNNISYNLNGIVVTSCNNTLYSRNNISDNINCGIFFSNANSHNTIFKNIIKYNGQYGIYLIKWIFPSPDSQYNVFSENIIAYNNIGLRLYVSINNEIKSNQFKENNQSGIYIQFSNNITITNNSLDFNYNGIVLENSSSYNTICDNHIQYSNMTGISLSYSFFNNISYNNISFSDYCGVYLYRSNFNYIIGNIFLDNNQNIIEVDCEGNIFEENGDGSENGDEPFLLIMIIILLNIAAIVIISGLPIYYYYDKKKLTRDDSFVKSKSFDNGLTLEQSSREILTHLIEKSSFFKVLRSNEPTELSSSSSDIELIQVKKEFLKKVDEIGMEQKDKKEFIKEMLALTEIERNQILDNILKRKKFFQ